MLFKLNTTEYYQELIIENHPLYKSLSILLGVSASLQVQISFMKIKTKEVLYNCRGCFYKGYLSHRFYLFLTKACFLETISGL